MPEIIKTLKEDNIMNVIIMKEIRVVIENITNRDYIIYNILFN